MTGAKRGAAERLVRRVAGRALLPLAIAAGAVLVWCGAFGAASSGPAPVWAAAEVFALAAGAALRRARRWLRREPASERELVEAGLALLVAAYALLAGTGGVASPLYPVVYLFSALALAFLPTAPALVLVSAAVGLETGVFGFGHLFASRWPTYATHVGFISLFAVLYHAVLAARLAAASRAEKNAVDLRVREAERSAREFRLIASAPGDGGGAQANWLIASVEEIESTVRGTLEIAHRALRSHTTALFLLTPDGSALRLRECVSAADDVERVPISAVEGALGGVVRLGVPVRLRDVKSPPHYARARRVGAMLAVPILEPLAADADRTRVRGVLVADRLESLPFSSEDEALLAASAAQVHRAVETERVMAAIRREKDEKERFYHAIEELNRAVKLAEVTGTAASLARVLCPAIDLCVLTLVDDSSGARRHTVAAAEGEGAEGLAGHSFADNGGLVANVVRLGAPLPGRPLDEMDRVLVLDEAAKLPKLSALRIFPLRAGDRVVGALTAMSAKKGAFDGEARHRLQILALQAAEALVRAQLFEATEKLATTDGLTGLHNHRRLQELLDGALKSARRYDRKVSFLLMDIDKFKSVNDTYGHPAGDAVLRGVARVLAQQARGADVVARYGGEEFGVLLPETDQAGARVIAERIRAAVEAATHATDAGVIRATISIGVATYPDDAREKPALVERADQALYAAKKGGRNRVVLAGDKPVLRKAAG